MFYIYRITNKINGKTYIGQHKYKKLNDNYMGSGVLLAKAKKKHGIENFEKEILYSRIQYKETADDMEKFAIAKERALGKAEYNIADGGAGGCGSGVNHPMYGKHHSKETIIKIAETKKGKPSGHKGMYHTEEVRRKISEAHKGRHSSEETIRKMSEALKGHKVSEETKQKISKGCTGKPKNRQVSHWKLVDGKRVYY